MPMVKPTVWVWVGVSNLAGGQIGYPYPYPCGTHTHVPMRVSHTHDEPYLDISQKRMQQTVKQQQQQQIK